MPAKHQEKNLTNPTSSYSFHA